MPSTDSAEGKARQRARNKEAGTRSGSSGAATKVQHMPSKLWDEIEDDVKHLTDLAGKISHSQVGAGGQMVATVSVPLEYAHDLLDVHMKARDGLVFMRMYYVSIEDYLGVLECPLCGGEGLVDDLDNDGGSVPCPECCDGEG